MSEVLNAALYGLGAFLSAFAALAVMAARAQTRKSSDAKDLTGENLVFLIRDGVIGEPLASIMRAKAMAPSSLIPFQPR